MVSRRERRLQRRRKKKLKEAKAELVEEKIEVQKTQNPIRRFYEEKYKQLMILPFGILMLAFIIIGLQIISTGDFVDKDVSLKGGLTITVLTEQAINEKNLESQLKEKFPDSDIVVRSLSKLGTQVGLIIDASDTETSNLVDFLRTKITDFDNLHSVESTGPSLGRSFFRQTMFSILFALFLMALVVFYYFRTFVPSLAVVLAAFSDIVVTIAIMNLLNIKLSTAGIAALLMLIGYSVDTDILLSTRVLKRKEGTVSDRMIGALKTGLTMNATTLTSKNYTNRHKR